MSTQAERIKIRHAVIRFAGDSGDGMQLTGTQFSNESAFVGNDLATFPNFPAEIRAPAGTLFGVSSFQVRIGEDKVWSPGDTLDTLVAMNPAALSVHLPDLKPGGTLIVDTDAFTARNMTKAHLDSNPLEDPELAKKYNVIALGMTELTQKAVENLEVTKKEAVRSKNMFALGVISHMYQRDISITERWLEKKFAKLPVILEANVTVLEAGYTYAQNSALSGEVYVVEPADMEPGTYRNINGNSLTAFGLITGAVKAGKNLVLGSYPITPATDILHELAKHKHLGVRTIQAEDEIAAVCAAIGASYAGAVGVTTTSGPGLALKGEAIGLAVMTELPLVVVNVQRGGPSTGLPTKTEQSDLLQAMYGRNGESPLVVLAAASPADAFNMAYEAVRIAITHMTPVILLTDGFIANSSAPWRIPNPDDIPAIEVNHPTDPDTFLPYAKDDKLVRPWGIPGTPGLEHRIGGLEKSYGDGCVSYDAENHQRMVRDRAAKVAKVADGLPPMHVHGPESGDLLIIGWGSTYGVIQAAIGEAIKAGKKVASTHVRYISPFPHDLEEIIGRYKEILVCEINNGQLAQLLRAKYLRPTHQLNKITGFPITQHEVEAKISEILGGQND